MPNWIPVQAWYDTESGRYYMGSQPPMNPQPQQPQQQQQYYSPPQPQQQYYRNVPSNHVMLGGQGGLVRYYQPMYQQPVAYEYYHNSYGQPVPMRVYPNNYGYPAQIGAYTGETNWQAAFPQQQQQQEVVQNVNNGWNDNPTTQEVIQNANSGWNDNPTIQESAQLQNDRIEEAINKTGVTDQTTYFDQETPATSSDPIEERKQKETEMEQQIQQMRENAISFGQSPINDTIQSFQKELNAHKKETKRLEKERRRQFAARTDIM